MDNTGKMELVTVQLLANLRAIIENAKQNVAASANYELTMMYWHIGERINRDVLHYQRAEYGKQIVSEVARQLQDEYGRKGFELRNIHRMMQFAKNAISFFRQAGQSLFAGCGAGCRLSCERFLPHHMDAFDASIARSLDRTAVVRITLAEPPVGKRKQYDKLGEEMKAAIK